MAKLETHRKHYEAMRKDAYRTENSDETRVEAFFLAAVHLIEACMATQNLHIGKHQGVRVELEANAFVFGKRTREVWGAFQDLETRLRPKVVYGTSWNAEDIRTAQDLFEKIEGICRGVLE